MDSVELDDDEEDEYGGASGGDTTMHLFFLGRSKVSSDVEVVMVRWRLQSLKSSKVAE